MNKYKIQPADIFLVDSNKGGPRIVKFFQTAPTWVHHLWRKFRGIQEIVEYYHVGMFIDSDNIIEQQGKVIERSSSKLLNTSNDLLIARRKKVDSYSRDYIIKIAREDIGKGYDVLNIFGKTLTWLTGISLFAEYIQWPGAEICVNRVAYWCKKAFKDTFSQRTHSDLTTHELYKYIKSNPDEWEIIFEGIPRDN